MDSISRRAFIGRASVTAAAAGVAVAIPATIASATTTGHRQPAEEMPADSTNSEPLIAQLKDLKSGEIALYSGLTEITVHDRALAHALARASGGK